MQSDERFGDAKFVRNMPEFYRATLGKVHVASTVINEQLVEVRTKKDRPTIKSPKYLAGAILSNSKMLMLDFLYNCLWRTYTPNTARVLYTDTDSLYIKFCGLTPSSDKHAKYRDMLRHIPADMQRRHVAEPGDLTVGKMKLEKLIDEAVFLKPKTYALRSDGGEEPHNKGVKVHQNRDQHRFEVYRSVLAHGTIARCTNTNIKRTDKFGNGLQMNTMQVDKIGLDAWEDKRRWTYDGTTSHSLPYGFEQPEPRRSLTQRMTSNLHARAQLCGFTGTLTEYVTDAALGCTAPQLLRHVERQFTVGMCRRNYGQRGWVLDHIVPVAYVKTAAFAALTDAQQRRLRRHIWHYTNVQPLMLADNSSKRDYITPAVQTQINNIIHAKE
jgi:hypothetical protein